MPRKVVKKLSKKTSRPKASGKKESPSELFRQTFDDLSVITDPSLEPVPELKFYPGRQWRIDWAWPDYKVAVEINGFGYGHGTVKAKKNDAEKMRALALCDWSLLVFTSACLGSKANRELAVYTVLDMIEMRMGNLKLDKNGVLQRKTF